MSKPDPALAYRLGSDSDRAKGVIDKRPATLKSASAIVELYQSIESLRDGNRPFVMQFLAPHSGAGTTTVARAFAQAAASTSATNVLLISAGIDGSGSIEQPALITGVSGDIDQRSFRAVEGNRNLWQARLYPQLSAGIALAPEDLSTCLTALRQRFSAIIIDCASLDVLPQAAMIAKFCDGTALVVQAERTSREAVGQASRSIEARGGQIVGAVFNRATEYTTPDFALGRWLRSAFARVMRSRRR